MDCRTAQLLLVLDRPHAPELSPEDRAQLGHHLSGCPACRALEQTERAIDDAIGSAMRNVPVPETLERELHQLLDREDQDQRRRWWRVAGRMTAAAAGVLFLVGGLLWWGLSARVHVDPDRLHEEFLAGLFTPLTKEDVENRFRDQGVTMAAPRGLNYDLLRDARLTNFQGRQVPCLLFDQGNDRPDANYVRVFVLPARQFDVRELAEALPSPNGYRFRVRTRYEEGDLYAYVFVHTGEDFEWLRVNPTPRPSV